MALMEFNSGSVLRLFRRALLLFGLPPVSTTPDRLGRETQARRSRFQAILSGVVARGRTVTTASWNWAVRRWVGVVMASCVALAAFGVVRADAETRFAAPGGTGSAPCLRSDPCSLYLAASYEAPKAERVQHGDEVIVLPGEYSGARGDLGPEELVQITGESSIHGEAGSPVPVIVSDRLGSVLTVASNESIASDLEIIAPNSTAPLTVSQSIAERMVVKTSAEEGIACRLGFRGVVRDSICISSGRRGAGAGQRVHTNSFTEHTRTLRNVTAIGTGPESNGIRFDISGGEIFPNVTSSIARGTATDIEAIGEEPGSGPTVTVEASTYATASAVEKDGGTASVTAPGTGTNITAAPLLTKRRSISYLARPLSTKEPSTLTVARLTSTATPASSEHRPTSVLTR